MRKLSNAIVLLGAGLVVLLLLGGQALAEPAAQLPEFDSWCAFLYAPEELVTISAGYPIDLAEADMDGDGHVEILLTTVETNVDSGTWKCHLFRIANPLPIGGSTIDQLAFFEGIVPDWGLTGFQQGFVSQIAVKDVNEDGLDDVVVVVQNATSDPDIYISRLLLVLGDSTGEFEVLEIPLDLGFFASGTILLSDLDGDGRIDIVVPDPLYRRLVILWGLSRNQFDLSSELIMPGEGYLPITVVDSDMNNDGNLDLVIGGFALQDSGTLHRFVHIAYGQGDALFELGFPMLIGWEEPTLLDISIAVADVDGNGWIDILVTYRSDVRNGISDTTSGWPSEETFVILSQLEPGDYYGREAAWASRSGPVGIERVDVHESGMRVLLHVPGNGFWLLEYISDSIEKMCPIPQSNSEVGLMSDIDGDGWLEAIIAARAESNVTTLWMTDPERQGTP